MEDRIFCFHKKTLPSKGQRIIDNSGDYFTISMVQGATPLETIPRSEAAW